MEFTLKPGRYRIYNPDMQLELQMESRDVKDGTPLVGLAKSEVASDSQAVNIPAIFTLDFALNRK